MSMSFRMHKNCDGPRRKGGTARFATFWPIFQRLPPCCEPVEHLLPTGPKKKEHACNAARMLFFS
ncbi:hypothetical protein YS110_02060 [Acidovorax sp. YS12]|nr:hypothetical protein YS110_02060 [Acidovorax sp. YS12]